MSKERKKKDLRHKKNVIFREILPSKVDLFNNGSPLKGPIHAILLLAQILRLLYRENDCIIEIFTTVWRDESDGPTGATIHVKAGDCSDG